MPKLINRGLTAFYYLKDTKDQAKLDLAQNRIIFPPKTPVEGVWKVVV